MNNDRDRLAKLRALEEEDLAKAKAAEVLRASGAPFTLWPDGIRSNDVDDGAPLTVDIRLGNTRIGHFYLEGRSDEHVRIDMIAIDRHHRRHRYGMQAMALVREVARREGYRCLTGEVERGSPEEMRIRRSFVERCGFKVNDDDSVELKLRRRFFVRPAPTGDWTKPQWFLDPNHAESLWSMRYERAELEDAYVALAELYDHEFCQTRFRELELLGQPRDDTDRAVRRFRQIEGLADLVRGLYEPHGIVSEILALGVDLALVRNRKSPARWLGRFKDPDGVRGAEFEAQVWANAIRSDLAIRQVPETKSSRPGIKTLDFEVDWNRWRVGLEAKSVETGEHDRMRFEHFPLIHPSPPDDREYHIELAPEIQALAGSDAGREQYRQICEDAEVALDEKRWELERAGSPLGVHEVPGAGGITIAERDPEFAGRSATISFTSEASQEKKARRLLPHLRNAAAKFRLWPDKDGRVAITMLDVPRDYNPEAVHKVVLREVSENRQNYRKTDAVVWRRIALSMDPDGDAWKTYYYYACFVMRLQWCPLSEGDLVDLTGLVLASSHRFFLPPRRRGQPDPFPSVREKMRIFATTLDLKKDDAGSTPP